MSAVYNAFKGITLNPLEERERQVIEPGSEILDGVLLTRVGVVVDVAENPEPYQEVLAAIDERLSWEETPFTLDMLKVVHAEVQRRILHYPSDYALVLKEEAEAQGLASLTPDHQIGLSRFVSVGVGICHQHSLLSGTMLRLMQDRGDLGGTVSLRPVRSFRHPNAPLDHPDRHTRIELIENGEEYIVDTVSGVSVSSRVDLITA